MNESKNAMELRTWTQKSSSDEAEDLHLKRTRLNDDKGLLRLGKKPVLKRNFGFMSILGFSCTVLITWEGILVTSVQSLLNGGPAGVIWGFLIDWIGTTSTFIAIAELASIAPTAAGQYHWVAMMAPARFRGFMSYVTAWVTIAGWQAVVASSAYLLGTLIQGMIALAHAEYIPQRWHTLLLFWSILFICVVVNSTTGKVLANFEGFILIFHLCGFFGVLIPMVYLGPHSDATVFSTFLNEGGWPTQALSFLVGLPASAFCLLGADSAVHMSEEIQGAAIIVPQALVYSLLINGTLAWAMVIALMFCAGDLENAIAAQETIFYPFLEIFQQAVNSTVGTCIMASIIVILGVASAVGGFAASSRMLWSFARDRGLPLSKQLSKLNSRTLMPFRTILVTLLIGMLLSLIVLGSSVAFNDIVSLSVVGLYSSYLLVCTLLLWRRLKGEIRPYSETAPAIGPGRLHWGPWRVPEPIGAINNLFACVYLVFLLFWNFWPPATPVKASTMNFSLLMFGATILFSVIWWLIRARKTFTGPIQEVELGE